jgi:hypothetical protein
MTVIPMKKAKGGKSVAKPYDPTSREKAALSSWEERKEKRSPLPLFKSEMLPDRNGTPSVKISIDHKDLAVGYTLQSEAIKSNSYAYYEGVLQSLATLATQGGETDEKSLNFAFSLVTGIEPRDQLESMLAVQMAAIHMATMTQARRLQGSGTLEQMDINERALNKLARTFATQVEALKRYRSKGEQRVIVKHVTVNEGGQAIVGNVAHGGGVDGKNAG